MRPSNILVTHDYEAMVINHIALENIEKSLDSPTLSIYGMQT